MSEQLFTEAQVHQIIAAALAEAGLAKGGTTAPTTRPKAKKAKAADAAKGKPAGLTEARQHCHDRRIARRTAPENAANAKGLTYAEKHYAYHSGWFASYELAVAYLKSLSDEELAAEVTAANCCGKKTCPLA